MLDLLRLKSHAQRPRLFEKGTASLWDDAHISKGMLRAHLDPNTDAASRKTAIIESTVHWLSEQFLSRPSSILDLGCGPGLYAKRLAALGHDVVGIDFSKRSIDYAVQDAAGTNLSLHYLYQNYLEIEYHETFDCILMIYCDFSVLNDQEQAVLLAKAYRALRPNGLFIFDIFNNNYPRRKMPSAAWTIESDGFWSSSPYLALSETFHYPSAQAFVDQYAILHANGRIAVYRNWNRYYSQTEIRRLLAGFNFSTLGCHDQLIASSTFTSCDVTFVVCQKTAPAT